GLIEVDGTYDDVNRLCGEASGEYPWAFVNVNLRPYYAEGSKTIAFETAEQLGWRAPDHVVVPIASGALLSRVGKAFRELAMGKLLDDIPSVRLSGAQGAGCAPVARAFAAGDDVRPVRYPATVAMQQKLEALGEAVDRLGIVREKGGS